MKQTKFIFVLITAMALFSELSPYSSDNDENPLIGTTWFNKEQNGDWGITMTKTFFSFITQTEGVVGEVWSFYDGIGGIETSLFTYTFNASASVLTLYVDDYESIIINVEVRDSTMIFRFEYDDELVLTRR